MCSPSPPPAPDYAGAARAQGGANVQSAIVNNLLNRPDEVTPYGSRTWTQTGTQVIPGAEGNAPVTVPTYTSNVSMTPQGQQLFDADTQSKLGLSQLENGAVSNVGAATSQPFDLTGMPQIPGSADREANRQNITDALYRRQTAMLDPQWDQQMHRTDNDLINRGFSIGDEGYTRAMSDQERAREAAYGDARDRSIAAGGAEDSRMFGEALQNRQQAITEALMQRTQPFQELSSIRTGAMPNMPSFQAYSAGANAQPAPIANATAQAGAYGTDLYNADVGQSNATLGAGASMATAAAMFF